MGENMKIQVLVAALNKNVNKLVEKMKISTDAIIGNQGADNSVEEIDFNGKQMKVFNFAEKGVGLNRNNVLMRATGDILLFADDDEIFEEDYEQTIKEAYSSLPNADAIIFNIKTEGFGTNRRSNSKVKRVRFFNSFNYGAVRISVRNDSIKRENITFHRQFGGGTEYSCGEDTLFISEMLNNKLKLYVYPAVIATVDQTSSTWFEGFNEKYFYDKGALFAALPYKFKWVMCILVLIKNRKELFKTIKIKKGFSIARIGFKNFKKGISFDKWDKNYMKK